MAAKKKKAGKKTSAARRQRSKEPLRLTVPRDLAALRVEVALIDKKLTELVEFFAGATVVSAAKLAEALSPPPEANAIPAPDAPAPAVPDLDLGKREPVLHTDTATAGAA